MKITDIFESASMGATCAGSVASVAAPTGGMARRASIYPEYDQYTKKKKKKKKDS